MELPLSLSPKFREVALVAALFAAVTTCVMWPLFGVMPDHFPAAASDSKLNAWVLAWGAERIPHALNGFWSPPIFYPYLNTLAYSENLLGVAAVVAPVQWMFGNPTLTYNIAFLLSFVVAGTTGYLLALTLTGSRSAAFIAGFAFAFTPYRWAQLPHLQVLWSAWLPLVLWALHGALRTHRWSFWLIGIVAVMLQVSSSGYSAFQLAIACGIVGVAAAFRYGINAASLRRMALAMIAAVLLLSSTFVTYYHVWSAREPTPGDLVAYSADLGTYLNVHPDLPGARWLGGVAQDEGHLFPGFIVLALTLVALVPVGRWRPVTRWRWVYLTLAVVGVLASLGPEPRAWGQPLPIPKLYAWLASYLPLFDAMRVPARFGVLAIVGCSALAAIGAARILGGMGRGARLVLSAGFCAIIVWEGHGPLTVVPNTLVSGAGDDAAFEWLVGQPAGPVLMLPMATLGGKFTMHQQYGALQHRHPIVDGVGRADTPLVLWLSGSASPLVIPEQLPEAVPFLRGLGVRYILMRRNAFRDPGIEARLYDRFEQDATLNERARFENVVVWEIEGGATPPAAKEVFTRVPSQAVSVSAYDHPDRISLAIDGDPNSRWMSRGPQTGSEWVALEFDRPRNLARIDFVTHSRSDINYPRFLEIVATGRAGGGAETQLFRGSLLPQLGHGWRLSPELPVASLDLPPYLTARVLIRQLGRAAVWWSIDELVLWER